MSVSKLAILAPSLSPDPRAAVDLARQLGFPGVEFDAYAPRLNIPDLSASGRREFRHLLSGNDQQLAALRVDLGNKGLSPQADIDRAIDRVDRALEAAAALQSPLVTIDLGPLPEPARAAVAPPRVSAQQAGLLILPSAADLAAIAAKPEPAREADAPFESSVDAALAELGRRADRYSAIIAFRADLASMAALDRALAAAACPWFGVSLDPVALLRDRWTADETFSRLGPQIRHVRARDAVAGHDKRTKPAPIGKGDTNWPELLTLLDEAAYNGWLTIDPLELPDRPTAAREALAHLKSLRK